MEQIKTRLKEMYPKRIEQGEFLGIDDADVPKKLKTVGNKLTWLKAFLKPLKLTIVITDLIEEV